MSTGIVAASAAAAALYYYWKNKGLENGVTAPAAVEAYRTVEHAPNSWTEALSHVKEVFRYVVSDTLGKWHTVDLFVGLAYLSHRETNDYPARDIASHGQSISTGLTAEQRHCLAAELREVRRYMLYCKGMKLKREELQAKYWRDSMGADTLVVIKQQGTAGVLKPAFVVVADHTLHAVVLAIRGTTSFKDLFTSLAAATKPHHVVAPDGVVLGYSHLGMLAAARWLIKQVTPVLKLALAANPDYDLRVVGHSMGGGTAAILTMMLRTSEACASHPAFATACCYAIACPSCMTLELAQSCRSYVTSVINCTDIVPTFSSASVETLREDVMLSSWYAEFQRDLRTSMLRTLQGGMRGMGTAAQWTTRNLLQPVALPFKSCYTLRRRQRSARSLADTASAGGSGSGSMSLGTSMDLDMLTVPSAPAAVSAPPGAMLMHSTNAPPMHPKHADADNFLHAEDADGDESGGMTHGSLPTLPTSPLQARAVQETLQSCLYAAGAAASAGAPTHISGPSAGSLSGVEAAMGLLEVLPALAGPMSGPHAPHAPVSSSSYMPSLPAGGQQQQQQGVPSLLSSWGGIGGAPRQQPAGSAMRRRLWPWGTQQGEQGAGGISCSRSSSSSSVQQQQPSPAGLGPTGSGSPSHAAHNTAALPYGQAFVHGTRSAAARAHEWLFKGMFNTCTAPRRGEAGDAGQHAAALDALSLAHAAHTGHVGGGGPGSALGAAAGQALAHQGHGGQLLDLDAAEDAVLDDGEMHLYAHDDHDEDDGDEDEEAAVAAALSGAGGLGSSSTAVSAEAAEQQLQAGITAVVAAVTNQPDQAARNDDIISAAEEVLREAVGSGPSSFGGALSSGTGRAVLLACEPPFGTVVGVNPLSTAAAGAQSIKANRLASFEDAGSSSRLGRSATLPLGRSNTEGGRATRDRPSAAATAAGAVGGNAAGASSSGVPPLSASVGGPGTSQPRPGRRSSGGDPCSGAARRLYPAGRVLHFFPKSSIGMTHEEPLPEPDALFSLGMLSSGSDVQTPLLPAEEDAPSDSRPMSLGGDLSAASAAVAAPAAAATPAGAAAAAAASLQQPYVLMGVADHSVYCRLKLCRSMVADHLVPAYLTALDSVLLQLEAEERAEVAEAARRAAMDMSPVW